MVVELIGKIVEVTTTMTSYTGKLIEINEAEVYLQTETGWVTISNESIISIREA